MSHFEKFLNKKITTWHETIVEKISWLATIVVQQFWHERTSRNRLSFRFETQQSIGRCRLMAYMCKLHVARPLNMFTNAQFSWLVVTGLEQLHDLHFSIPLFKVFIN